MRSAAVPEYVGQAFQDSPPGHRFGLYFRCWSPGQWERSDAARTEALAECTQISQTDMDWLSALLARQQSLAAESDNSVMTWSARSTAPFVTGLGMEHPSENGFAFSSPYGMPYLPGASIKGVLRNAAERLALGIDGQDPAGWDMLKVWLLFGFDGSAPCLTRPDASMPDMALEQSERWRQLYVDWVESNAWEQELARDFVRRLGCGRGWQEQPENFLLGLANGFPSGAGVAPAELALAGNLAFWDVTIRPGGRRLDVEILTPHYTHYYRDAHPPHESGQPVPNPFLVVPPDSEFHFFVQACPKRLPEMLRESWQQLVRSAFIETADWAGFGAKTAVGYGILTEDQQVAEKAREAVAEQEVVSRQARMSAEELAIEAVVERLEQERKSGVSSGPGGELAMLRNELLNTALEWDNAELRQRAAEVVAGTVTWIAWPKKKKAERNQALARLRDMP